MNGTSDKEIRERLVTRGAASLGNDELLSLLLTPTGERSAVEMARALLEREGCSLASLSEYELGRLRMSEGLGMKNAAMLSAAFELGRRANDSRASQPDIIRDKMDVVELLGPQLSRLTHEEMWVLYLNSANRILEKRRIAQGGVNKLVVDYKLVVKRAVELLAGAMIVVHNHPSGVAEPSDEDRDITDRLVQAAGLFDIMVIDHIIISADGNYSFRQNGLLKNNREK